MTRVWKNTLRLISALPILWTIAILISAYFYIRHPDLVELFLFAVVIYFLGGLELWVIVLFVLTWKRQISVKEFTFNICIIGFGILLAFLSLKYDIFGVSRSYID